MGGRVASMVADVLFASGKVCVCCASAIPFIRQRLRAVANWAHLVGLKTPMLIVQGTRDAFGSREDVCAYTLSPATETVARGLRTDDLKPRREAFSVLDWPIISKVRRKRWRTGLKHFAE